VRQKLYPFYFLNNFVKSRSILIIFGAQIPEWICNKKVTKLSTSPNECHYTTLWNTTCQIVHNHSNASTKRHDKLTVTDKHISTNVQSVCPLALTRALRRFRYWLIAWSVMLCGIPTMLKSFLQALSLNVFLYDASHWPPRNASFLAIWRVVLCVPGAPSWLSAKSLTVSMFSAARDVRSMPLPSCQSVVPVSRSSLRR